MFHVPEVYRLKHGNMGSTIAAGNNGYFIVPSCLGKGRKLLIIASDGMGWDHVSVHVEAGNKQITPLWDEMCFIKDLFWDEDDVVVQYHPRKADYINVHPHTLHIWRPTLVSFPVPPKIFV